MSFQKTWLWFCFRFWCQTLQKILDALPLWSDAYYCENKFLNTENHASHLLNRHIEYVCPLCTSTSCLSKLWSVQYQNARIQSPRTIPFVPLSSFQILTWRSSHGRLLSLNKTQSLYSQRNSAFVHETPLSVSLDILCEKLPSTAPLPAPLHCCKLFQAGKHFTRTPVN